MKNFFLILSFFTRLPVPFVPYTEERYKKGIKMVPFIGLIIGVILYCASYVDLIINDTVAAFFLALLYLILTGGLHLDGMADSCDGLFSGRDKDKMLEIMRDSRIGAFGVISLIIWFAFYIIVLPFVSREAILIFPMIGKACSLLSAFLSDYARSSGLGKVYVENCKKLEVSIGLALVLVSVIFVCWHHFNSFVIAKFLMFMISVVITLISTILITYNIKKKLGGATGDTLGFICEVSQIIFLAMVYVVPLIIW